MDPRKYRVAYNITAALIIAAIFLVAGFIIERKVDSYFNQLQEEATVQNIRVIEGIFERELESLSILASDWTLWDEMYKYAADPDSEAGREFAKVNFEDITFEQIGINVLIIANRNNEVVFSKQIYDRSSAEKNVSDAVLKEASSLWPKDEPADSDVVRRKIIDLGARKLLLASRHITKADTTGEPTGVLFFGRYIEKEFLKEFENIPGFYFNVAPYHPDDPESLYPDISEASPLKIKLENIRKVIGIKLIKDISTQQPFILEIEHVPTVYSKFIDIIMFMVFVFSAAYFVILFTVIFLFNRICPVSQKCEYIPSGAEKTSEQSDTTRL